MQQLQQPRHAQLESAAANRSRFGNRHQQFVIQVGLIRIRNEGAVVRAVQNRVVIEVVVVGIEAVGELVGVGQAMRKAPRGRKLPWHRVVNAQGRISFPADSAGYQRQKRRLEEEGVVFVEGSINLEQYGYQGALDHLLWSEPL